MSSEMLCLCPRAPFPTGYCVIKRSCYKLLFIKLHCSTSVCLDTIYALTCAYIPQFCRQVIWSWNIKQQDKCKIGRFWHYLWLIVSTETDAWSFMWHITQVCRATDYTASFSFFQEGKGFSKPWNIDEYQASYCATFFSLPEAPLFKTASYNKIKP